MAASLAARSISTELGCPRHVRVAPDSDRTADIAGGPVRARFGSREPHSTTIPRSRHNPKILGVDDAEIIGDRITEVGPIPRNFFTEETERRIGELGASHVGFIVRDMLVHHAP